MVTAALRRDLTPVNAFCITFSTVGVLWVFSRDPLSQGIVHGGPVVMVWGWLAVSGLNVVTALCLAELAACMPAAIGSIYVFTARLAPWHKKAIATWVAAWANLAAALGATAYYALVTTRTLNSAARLARISASAMPYDPADPTLSLSPAQQFGIYAAVLLSWQALVCAPLTVTAGFITGASLWQLLGGGTLFAALLALTPRRQSAAYIFSEWHTANRQSDVSSVPYNVLEGLMFAITAQTGYETVLYFVEEMQVHRRRRRKMPRWQPGTGRQGQGQPGWQGQHEQKPAENMIVSGSYARGSMHGAGALYDSTTGASAATNAVIASPDGGVTGGLVHRGAPTDRQQGQGQGQQEWPGLYGQAQQEQREDKAGGSSGGGWRSQSVVPESIFGGFSACCALSLLFLCLLLAAAPSLPHAVDPRNETLGQDPMSQIIYDVLRLAYGTGRGAPGLVAVITVGTYGTGLVTAAGASRKLWAMASDGFVPSWLSALSELTRVPVLAAHAALTTCLAPGLLLLVGDWAAAAALSFVTVTAAFSYLLPLSFRLMPHNFNGGDGGGGGYGGGVLNYEATARRVRAGGGFTLGRASRPLFWVAAVWLVFSMALALLPGAWPLAAERVNWAVVSSAAVAAAVAASWWCPRWGARRWFRGLASVGGVSFC